MLNISIHIDSYVTRLQELCYYVTRICYKSIQFNSDYVIYDTFSTSRFIV